MLSVIIIVRNEAENIQRCLESIKWVDEIIIVDSGSTDNTIELAKPYTEHIYREDWQGYGVQKQRALEKATGDWILNIDADEVVTDALKDQIQKAISSNQYQAYQIPIRLVFYQKILRYTLSPTKRVRLFQRADASYTPAIVHESILLPKNSQVGQLTFPILHFSYRDLTEALAKMNLYSSSSALIRDQKNKSKPSFIKVGLSAIWMFFRNYVLQRWFLDGKEGLLFAFLSAESAFYRGMKQLYPDSAP